MSGGIAYVLDRDGTFAKCCNASMVDLEPLLTEAEQRGKLPAALWHKGRSDEAIVRSLIEQHQKFTGSRQAAEILGKWAEFRSRFVKVFPKEYRRALGELAGSPKKVA
jgi:glutamate synthase domain-containing protein 3